MSRPVPGYDASDLPSHLTQYHVQLYRVVVFQLYRVGFRLTEASAPTSDHVTPGTAAKPSLLDDGCTLDTACQAAGRHGHGRVRRSGRGWRA